MKRFFTLAMALLAMNVAADAQLKFGVEAGLNINAPSSFSKAEVEKMVNPENSLGWFAGLKAKYQFAMGLGVDGAVLFSQRKNDMGESSQNLRYIEVPINLRYQISLIKMLSLYAAVGPQWSVNVGDREWSLNDITNTSGVYNELYEGAAQHLSANLGAGVILFDHLQVGFNYNLPLTKTGEVTVKSVSDDVVSNWKNKTWQIRAAYFF
ncbi:MAG: porin family protein [Bacteroidaceae bacterium]|nr:porin family protein [Bacteroidaceae bacterium]